ncbi:hypothetical protein A5N17_17165 [Arthrobacter sp. D2]|nr:hypothetical protein [Arthrobacter sp. M5]NKR16887.1 hypothetical protein [Arthrobacter sp. M6]OEH60527.1 hypothetical protein A5N13_06125 [Arthrobacter sp. D4]OEH61142.1 hypothetical protein A5N17_17165 [Arthrobacter sp. D2]
MVAYSSKALRTSGALTSSSPTLLIMRPSMSLRILRYPSRALPSVPPLIALLRILILISSPLSWFCTWFMMSVTASIATA